MALDPIDVGVENLEGRHFPGREQVSQLHRG